MISSAVRLKYYLQLIDVWAITTAFILAYYLRNYGPFITVLTPIQHFSIYLKVYPYASTLLLVLFSLSGLYEQKNRIKYSQEIYLVIKAISFWWLLLMSSAYLYKYDYSRITVILFYFLAMILVSLGRLIFKRIENYYYSKGLGINKIIIIGAGRPGRELARRLKKYEAVGYRVIGFLDDYVKYKKNYPIIGKLKDIAKIVTAKKINEIYISDPNLSHEQIMSILDKCYKKDISFKIISNVFGPLSKKIDMADLESIPALYLGKAKNKKFYKTIKGPLDILTASILLIVTLPLWLVIWYIIIKEDGQPVILKQKRVGKDGKIFQLYKFRTMKKETSLYADSPNSRNDKRITKIGRFLRSTSLDELPQLINIIKGEMSLIGPRPEMPQIVKKYRPWQKKRLVVKPGLTGLWQILGRKDLPLEYNLEYDFYYINNQSPLLDVSIILRTIPSILKGTGAF